MATIHADPATVFELKSRMNRSFLALHESGAPARGESYSSRRRPMGIAPQTRATCRVLPVSVWRCRIRRAAAVSKTNPSLPADDRGAPGTQMLTCEVLADEDIAAWQQFASARPGCGLYHDVAWRDVVAGAYGHRPLYVVAKRNGAISGVVPLVLTASRLFGRSLTSLPFLDFAGIVADDGESRDALLAKAEQLGRELRVHHVELRQREPVSTALATSTHKVLMTMPLGATEDETWRALPSERRNRVRRATKTGLSVEVAGSEELPVFYDIWTRNMRDLGSPPHSREFFDHVLRAFPERHALLFAKYQGRSIGAALALHFKDTIAVPWVSSLREYFDLYPNNILYWEAMRFAIGRGLTTFDFGRSTRDSGTYEFKLRWGAKPTPLHWHFLPVRGKAAVPLGDDDKFRLAVALWKRMPVGMTRMIGPALRKHITA
jgi:FemAB-related protein (PEP-CTERM system-associated)